MAADREMAAAPAAFEHGVMLYRQGRLADAEIHLVRLLDISPQHVETLHLLGVIAAQTGRLDRAIELISRAIAHNGTVAAAHRHLGNALRDVGRLQEAIASYDKAIALRADFKEAHAHRGFVLLTLRRAQEALASFDRAIACGADDAAVHTFRGSALIDLQRPVEAAASCGRAISRQENFPAAHANRAAALYVLGRYEEALASCDTAISLQPGYAEAHAHRGAVLFALRRLDAALASLDTAIALQPRSAFAHNLRGLALLDLQRPEAALASCNEALALQPDFADAYNNRGLAQSDLRQWKLAIDSFDQAIALRPQVSEPYFNKAIRHLQAGDFESGWELYERRPTSDRVIPQAWLNGVPWNGEQTIAGKTIFTYGEQGLGDTLQFCRYAKLLEARGARVVLSVQDGLRTLLRGLGSTIEVIGASERPGEYDFHCPLLSLPRVLRTRIDSIPAAIPYLRPDPDRVAKWRERLGAQGRLLGIRWQGSTRRVDIGRSFPLRQFAVLADIPGVRLVSLQKGPGSEQLLSLPPQMRVEDLGSDFEPEGPDAFLDVAAVMHCLDLVITSDTSIAHLAGALGRPTWVALKYQPDWRWMLDRDDSPWYPTMRLFRQQRPGDWDGVFARIRGELTGASREYPQPPHSI
jgi:tetratricopeptide (TPR) repeat protein